MDVSGKPVLVVSYVAPSPMATPLEGVGSAVPVVYTKVGSYVNVVVPVGVALVKREPVSSYVALSE